MIPFAPSNPQASDDGATHYVGFGNQSIARIGFAVPQNGILRNLVVNYLNGLPVIPVTYTIELVTCDETVTVPLTLVAPGSNSFACASDTTTIVPVTLGTRVCLRFMIPVDSGQSVDFGASITFHAA